jgi:hypothetical protein
MRKDRFESVLSYVKVSRLLPITHLNELESCSGCQNHCLKLLIVYDRLGMVAKLVLTVQITSRTHMF